MFRRTMHHKHFNDRKKLSNYIEHSLHIILQFTSVWFIFRGFCNSVEDPLVQFLCLLNKKVRKITDELFGNADFFMCKKLIQTVSGRASCSTKLGWKSTGSLQNWVLSSVKLCRSLWSIVYAIELCTKLKHTSAQNANQKFNMRSLKFYTQLIYTVARMRSIHAILGIFE